MASGNAHPLREATNVLESGVLAAAHLEMTLNHARARYAVKHNLHSSSENNSNSSSTRRI